VQVARQGRAALVTSIQMFKILGVNCLLSAFALSVQYLQGVRWGDTQGAVAGVFSAVLFMLLSLAQPAQTLSPQRPHTRVFCAYALLSIAAQFAAHLALLWGATELAARAQPLPPDAHPDADFSPNLVNTAAFLASQAGQAATFAANYVGSPFNAPLSSNRGLLGAILGLYLLLSVLASNAWPELSAALELVAVPEELYSFLFLGAAADAAVCLAAERALRAAFPERHSAAALALAPGI